MRQHLTALYVSAVGVVYGSTDTFAQAISLALATGEQALELWRRV